MIGEPSSETAYLALGGRHDYGMLSHEAGEFFEHLQQVINTGWREATSPADRQRFEATAGCLSRLEGFLLQEKRIADYANLLRQRPLDGIASPRAGSEASGGAARMVVRALPEACTDFESLLFHARAVLDRLAWFLGREHRNSCIYSSLRAVLENVTKRLCPYSSVDWVAG